MTTKEIPDINQNITDNAVSIVSNVATDVGSGFTKIVTDTEQHFFPSIVAPFPNYDFFGADSAEKITAKSGEWIVGESARNSIDPEKHCNTLQEDWAGSSGWVALLYAGLARLNLPSTNIRLITGLPQAFYADKQKRMELIDQLKGNHEFLLGNEKSEVKNFSINIIDVKIIPQASGAMFCRATQDNSISDYLAGIIDIGTFTTGLCAIRKGDFVHNKAGGVCMGVSILADKCALHFSKEHGVKLDRADVYEALRTKKILVRNAETDVGKEVNDIALLIAEPIIKEIQRCWDNANNMRVIISGGGAPFFIGAIRNSIPHAELMEDNFFAVARGMHIYLKAKSST